jgi:hypothetical protein
MRGYSALVHGEMIDNVNIDQHNFFTLAPKNCPRRLLDCLHCHNDDVNQTNRIGNGRHGLDPLACAM